MAAGRILSGLPDASVELLDSMRRLIASALIPLASDKLAARHSVRSLSSGGASVSLMTVAVASCQRTSASDVANSSLDLSCEIPAIARISRLSLKRQSRRGRSHADRTTVVP